MLPKGGLCISYLTRDMEARRSREKSQQARRDAKRRHHEEATMILQLLAELVCTYNDDMKEFHRDHVAFSYFSNEQHTE